MPRQSLGRGLSALLGDDKPTETAANLNEIDIDLIEPNPQQPRTRFGETALDELARSIAANGIVQPIVVRPVGSRFQIVAGERRWRAAQRTGLRRVPIVVRHVEDDKLLEVALIENIQRQELNPIEEARAYLKLIDNIGLTQEQVSEQVGKERTLIATSLRLLKLPADILELIEAGKLTAGHGRALLLSTDAAIQRVVARKVIEKGMSVRETERQVKTASADLSQSTKNKRVTVTKDANIRTAETKMMRALATNVKITPKQTGKGGKIEIEYYNMDDLDRLYQILVVEKRAARS